MIPIIEESVQPTPSEIWVQSVARPLRHRTGASGSPRVEQLSPGDFICCERQHTDPMGACSWLCECTQPVRCRSL